MQHNLKRVFVHLEMHQRSIEHRFEVEFRPGVIVIWQSISDFELFQAQDHAIIVNRSSTSELESEQARDHAMDICLRVAYPSQDTYACFRENLTQQKLLMYAIGALLPSQPEQLGDSLLNHLHTRLNGKKFNKKPIL